MYDSLHLFVSSPFNGNRHATIFVALDDELASATVTIIGRSANQGGRSFASSPEEGGFLHSSKGIGTG